MNIFVEDGLEKVGISDTDLEPLVEGQRYAKLKPEVIDALSPKEQGDGTFRFAVLRAEDGIKFQLPEDCILLALEGRATAAATGSCGIWFCEDLSLDAEVAFLGSGRVRLDCNVVSLLARAELEMLFPGVAHRLTIAGGRAEYMVLAPQESVEGSSLAVGAEIEGHGRIGRIDRAIARPPTVLVEQEVDLSESLREAIQESLWETGPQRHNERIDAVLGLPSTTRVDAIAESPQTAARIEQRGAEQGEGQSLRNPPLRRREQQGSQSPSTGESEGKGHKKGIR
jgi:hypothetical protein